MVEPTRTGEDLILTAKNIAFDAHRGQVRKFGEDKGKPYIIHPMRVAHKFENAMLKATAILHDVLEDSDTDVAVLIDRGIPLSVIAAVLRLTHSPKQTYLEYILRVKGNVLARKVKIEDIKDNLSSLPAERKSMRDKYLLAKYILEADIHV